MLIILYVAPAVFANGFAFAQTTYQWKATLRAVDESGDPIGGANAQIGYYANSQPVNAAGTTDTNGIFTASHSALSSMAEVSCQAEKAGYYTTWVRRELGPKYDPAQWIFMQTLVLKKVLKPTAMYAKQVLSLVVPAFNKPIGYDLMVGDWVAPYGKGSRTDLFFTEKHPDEKSDYILTMSFPNPGDGVQEFIVPEAEEGSSLRSPHEAPLDGYQPKIAQTTMTNPNRNLFFRVRTVLDDKGFVKSALYGKIYGDLAQFTYYLNPSPNDRNLEFDPKHNLLPGQNITAP